MAIFKPSKKSANPGGTPSAGLGSEWDWIAVRRRDLYTNNQCPWGIDTAFGERGKRAAARAVERPVRSDGGLSRGVCWRVARRIGARCSDVFMVKSISVTLECELSASGPFEGPQGCGMKSPSSHGSVYQEVSEDLARSELLKVSPASADDIRSA